jgi:hypothetical protein
VSIVAADNACVFVIMRTGGNESGGRRWEGLSVLRGVFGAGRGVLSYMVDEHGKLHFLGCDGLGWTGSGSGNGKRVG